MDVNGISLESTANPAVTGLVNDANSHSNADIAQKYNSGTSQARGLLNTPDHMNDQLSYGNKAQTDAIKSRYDRSYGRQETALSLKTMMNADADHVRNLQNASQLANQEVETNRQKDLLKNKINQANKRARGQVLGTVLGITGAVAAGYATGGAGAGAGYAAGDAAGNMIGSAN